MIVDESAVRNGRAVTRIQAVLDHAVRALVGRPGDGGRVGGGIAVVHVGNGRGVGEYADVIGADRAPHVRGVQLRAPEIYAGVAARGRGIGLALERREEFGDLWPGHRPARRTPSLAGSDNRFDRVPPLAGEAILPGRPL